MVEPEIFVVVLEEDKDSIVEFVVVIPVDLDDSSSILTFLNEREESGVVVVVVVAVAVAVADGIGIAIGIVICIGTGISFSATDVVKEGV